MFKRTYLEIMYTFQPRLIFMPVPWSGRSLRLPPGYGIARINWQTVISKFTVQCIHRKHVTVITFMFVVFTYQRSVASRYI